MSGIDDRMVAVLEDLARLGRRIGERAAELARLAGAQGGDAGRARAEIVDAAALVADRAASMARSRPGERTARVATRRSRPRPETKAPSTSVGPPRGGRAGARGRRPDPRRPKPRLTGAVAASSIVHLLVLVGLACFVVTIDAEPVRVALTLGEATGPDSPFDDAAPLDVSVVEAPEQPVDEVPLDVPPEEPSLAEDLRSMLESQAPDAAMTEALTADVLAGVVAAPLPGGGGEEGGAAGARRGGVDAPRASATFFGRQGTARSVCFLCDNSNSYRDGAFHRVLDEIARAVDGLSPEQTFFVIFFSDAAYPLFHPSAVEMPQAATPENKRRVREWLGTVEMCRGGKGIDDAMRLAGTLGVDVMYLLSDGELGGSVVERLVAADVGGSVVHTFGLQGNVVDRRTGLPDPERFGDQQRRNASLIAIATAHGGTFTPVAVAAQAARLEKTHPIRRNRSRGAVWGLGL